MLSGNQEQVMVNTITYLVERKVTVMTRTLAKVVFKGVYKVIYDDAQKVNPYRIIKYSRGHQKQIERYGDFQSCMYHLYQITSR